MPRSWPNWSLTPARRNEPVLMDAPGLAESEVAAAYRVLRKVNHQLGNLRSMRRELGRFLDEDGPGVTPVTLLDLGSGSGDIPRDLLARHEARGIAGVAVRRLSARPGGPPPS